MWCWLSHRTGQALSVSVLVVPEHKDSGRTSTNISTGTARRAERCLAWCLIALPVLVPFVISDDSRIVHHSNVAFLDNTWIPRVHCLRVEQ